MVDQENVIKSLPIKNQSNNKKMSWDMSWDISEFQTKIHAVDWYMQK